MPADTKSLQNRTNISVFEQSHRLNQRWRQDRFEFVVGAACFLVTLFPDILVAFVLALINLAKRAADPAIDVLASTGEPTDSVLDEAPSGAVQ